MWRLHNDDLAAQLAWKPTERDELAGLTTANNDENKPLSGFGNASDAVAVRF
jgi:hypothetical protein